MLAEAATARRPVVRWHLVYYLLAAFDVLAITGSLYLSHEIMGIFSNSVQVNQGWADKLGDLTNLRLVVAAVNAPGNDVFDTHDVDKEVAREKLALTRFRGSIDRIQESIERVPTKQDREILRTGIQHIVQKMDDMLAESSQIFSYFRANDSSSAGRRMATMDRKFAMLNAKIGEASNLMRDIQRLQFEHQVAAARFLGRFEYVFGGLIVLMVSCVLIYGHRIAAEFKKHEIARQRHTSELENLSLQLQNSLAESVSANRAKSEFLATMSHELRTPLNAVIGFAEIIHKRLSDLEENHICAGYAVDIKNSGKHLLTVVNQILDQSKIEAGRMTIESAAFDLGALVNASVQSMRVPADEKGLTLNVLLPSEPVVVHADERAIRQILLNLVSNAIKFTSTGKIGLVVIQDRESIEISVTDTGCGIAQEHLERIFFPFEQVDNSYARRFEGTGLGLPIVASLVKAHGGTCSVESVVGLGSRFWVRLPIALTVDGKEHNRAA